MKEKSGKIIYGMTILLLFVSVVVLYMVHEKIPFMMDDLWYATRLYDDVPIASVKDIVESQIWHYHNWGGRSMTHGILQLTLLAGEKAADVLNILVTFLLAFLICRTAGVNENPDSVNKDTMRNKLRVLPWLLAAMGMLLGLNANWKMSMFWQAGAANYLYITVFIIGFWGCYLKELSDEGCILPWKASAALDGIDKKGTFIKLFGMIPLGILAGWSNENMGPATWIVSLLVILLHRKEKKKVKGWMLTGNISCLFGSIMVVAAPGNFVRDKQVISETYGTLWKAFLQSYGICNAALNYLFPTLLLTGALLIICKGILKISVGRRNQLLLLGALLSWGAMILSPHYPDRASFGTMAILLCVILNLAKRIFDKRQELGAGLWGMSLLIWLRGMFFLGEFLAICWGWIG